MLKYKNEILCVSQNQYQSENLLPTAYNFSDYESPKDLRSLI